MQTEERVLAAVTVQPGVTEVKALPRPKLDAYSGLLKVEVTGVCGADVGMYARSDLGVRIMGHEIVGTVTEVGREAQRTWGLKEGDRIALEEYIPCGVCAVCRSGMYRACFQTDIHRNPQGLRYGTTPLHVAPGLWGGYAQYLYLHPNMVFHRLPARLPAEWAALALPLANGVQWAVYEGKAGPGSQVLVIGPGQQGLSCALAAKRAGADRVILAGLPRDQFRLRIARQLGVDHTLMLTEDADLVAGVLTFTAGEPLDLVIDTAAGNQATLVPAVQLLRRGGRLLLATAQARVDRVPLREIQKKALTLQGLRGHSYQAVEDALALLKRDGNRLQSLTTHHFGLSEVDAAISATAGQGSEDALHVAVHPWLP
ncbi:MAG: zinc-binding dehydrogenase [Alicyclobacillus sp.]|nr:zinc-binding dehydrogenase [Alicyclobacillus sp.]